MQAPPKDIIQAADHVANVIAEALDRGEAEGAAATRSYIQQIIDRMLETPKWLECIYYMTMPQNWYHVLWVIGEMTPYMDKLGFRVPKTVPANSSATSETDLTGTGFACVCPKRIAASELGPNYSKLTVLVNEKPVQEVKESDWLDVYVCQNEMIPTNPPSLTQGDLYTFMPKYKIKITFYNTYTSSGEMTYFADYMRMTKARANNLIRNCYIPFKAIIIERIVKEPREYMGGIL